MAQKKSNAKKDDGIKVTMVTKKLPVKLDDDELLDRGRALVQNMRKTAEAEEAREAENKRRKGDIALLEGVTARLSTAISTGTEDKDVDCEERKDFIHGTVTIVRMDTGEVVDQRVMSAEERQEKMFADKPEQRDPAKGKGGDPFADDGEKKDDGGGEKAPGDGGPAPGEDGDTAF